MTRLYLWTVCAVVVLVGSYRWYSKLHPKLPELVRYKWETVYITNYVTERRYVDVEVPRYPARIIENEKPIYMTNGYITNVVVYTANLYATNLYVTNLWSSAVNADRQ